VSEYHRPVLLQDCLDALQIDPQGTYVDVTFGGGGHSRGILSLLGPEGRLLAFDQDQEALSNAPDDPRLQLIHSNFRHLQRFLRLHKAVPVDGILADLGVSSHQFDAAYRGFSYRFDGPLDMRMNAGQSLTAARIIETYSEEQLQQIFSAYGELRNSRQLASRIAEARRAGAIHSTFGFLEAISPVIRGDRPRYLSQVFQALRMEVNDELGALKEFLQQSVQVLKPGGILAVITFHSLEDRLTKQFMRNGLFADEPEKDAFGNWSAPLELLGKKPIVAAEKELKENPRSRSAKLRVARKK
jgi:16S rRNA (cytosine1402-N4)-methyltransferase